MPAEIIGKDFEEKKDKGKREFKLAFPPISVPFKTENGDMRYNLYGVGTDGALYKKLGVRFTDEGRESRGWVRLNMIVEFEE